MRYVGLLAFKKIIESHSHLVSPQADVIMSCVNDPDMSIKMLALELGAGLIDSYNLMDIVEQLMQQLQRSPFQAETNELRLQAFGVRPAADYDGEDPAKTLQSPIGGRDIAPVLPSEYRVAIIRRILDLCSKNYYANITDFGWYIQILVQLASLTPHQETSSSLRNRFPQGEQDLIKENIASAIGWELRSVATRVSAIRAEAVNAANSLLSIRENNPTICLSSTKGAGILYFAAWITGEYAVNLVDAYQSMRSLTDPRVLSLSSTTLTAYLQSIPKVLTRLVLVDCVWNLERQTTIASLFTRIIEFLEFLTIHHVIEVQERAVQLLELLRMVAQAIKAQGTEVGQGPFLLTQAMPSLFTGYDINPVAPIAQKKVPLPIGLDLDMPLHHNLAEILQTEESGKGANWNCNEFLRLYSQRKESSLNTGSATSAHFTSYEEGSSYQQLPEGSSEISSMTEKRKERERRLKFEPFYISNDGPTAEMPTNSHELFRSNSEDEVNVDSIPIMSLDIEEPMMRTDILHVGRSGQLKKSYSDYEITPDENIESEKLSVDHERFEGMVSVAESKESPIHRSGKTKKGLLEVDSSGLGGISMNDDEYSGRTTDLENHAVEEVRMIDALKEIERLRLEMQRTLEKTEASVRIPPEGTLIKKRKKKKEKPKRKPM